MPSVDLEYSKVSPILDQTVTSDDVIATPYGLCIVEIQGVLNLPKDSNSSSNDWIKVEDVYDAVKFGKIQISDSKVTLFIGNSQRLEGRIETLDPPLGVLKIPTPSNEKNDSPNESTNPSTISMIDIIKKKIIFRQRPLPIM